MIDRIEIYKGVVPAKFGGSAVGGAVNIVIKEYPPKYLDVNYSYGSFNTHNASVVSKMNIAPKGIEFGLGGFYTYADNDYKMKSPFQEGLTITRDHDKFKKQSSAVALRHGSGGLTWWSLNPFHTYLQRYTGDRIEHPACTQPFQRLYFRQ